jgi:hypothetical protein
MIMTTTMPTAAPRTQGASPFVVPMAPEAWLSASATAVAGSHTHADQALQAARIVPNPKVRVDASNGTKQDRPPRGVPR